MSIYQVFPFEYIKKNSKVIIYGLGKYGMSYIEQVEATDWCEIVGVSDADGERKVQDYSFVEIEKLCGVDTDYIVIAIAAVEAVNHVYRKLIEYGVSDTKIVSTLSRTQHDYRYLPKKTERAEKPDCLRILLIAKGGLGDCVISLSVYEKIADMLQNAEIDIKCRKVYGEVLYADRKFIHAVYDEQYEADPFAYDIILNLEHGIHVAKYDEKRCVQYSFELSEKVRLLQQTFDTMRGDIIADQYRFALQIRRAIVRGWDRYRALGHGDVLNLSPDMVKVTLAEKYFSSYSELGLGKFITFNCGADVTSTGGRRQVKVWPAQHYQQFIPMFKARYPEYEVVQLGDNGIEQIEGADRLITGKHLELVKYILKNSSLHIDCEGGLVHLATVLGTKCAVLFGPTPVEYYGYPQNINIRAGKCQGCAHLLKDWYVKCLQREAEPVCMYDIKPQMVLEKISGYLDKAGGCCECI